MQEIQRIRALSFMGGFIFMDVSKQVIIIQEVSYTKIIQIGCHYSAVKLF